MIENPPTIFLIRPHRGSWECFATPGVQPYFMEANGAEKAIRYAKRRTAHRHGEIRVVDAEGDVLETLRFDERTRRL